MPKVTFVYDMPEDKYELWLHTQSHTFFSALWEIDQHCRSVVKHGHQYKSVEDLAQAIRGMMPSLEED